MDEIKPGDIVELKSGGPRMTVTDVGKTASGVLSAWCEWFDDSKVQKAVFALQALKRVPE